LAGERLAEGGLAARDEIPGRDDARRLVRLGAARRTDAGGHDDLVEVEDGFQAHAELTRLVCDNANGLRAAAPTRALGLHHVCARRNPVEGEATGSVGTHAPAEALNRDVRVVHTRCAHENGSPDASLLSLQAAHGIDIKNGCKYYCEYGAYR
jgi:hypothetical protein